MPMSWPEILQVNHFDSNPSLTQDPMTVEDWIEPKTSSLHSTHSSSSSIYHHLDPTGSFDHHLRLGSDDLPHDWPSALVSTLIENPVIPESPDRLTALLVSRRARLSDALPDTKR